jgi:CheY-like chemotaxis protein
MVNVDGSIAHVLVVGDVAKALKVSAEEMDTLGGTEARVTRTVLRSEVLRILASGPLDVMITSSDASFLGSADFLAAFAARVVPVSLLMLTRKIDKEALQRLRGAGAQVEHIAPPIALDALHERVRQALRQRNLTSRTTCEPLPGLARRIQSERGSFTLHVNAGIEYGSLTFLDGVLVDAQNARRTGDRAALDILGWRQTSVVFDRVVPLAPATVRQGLDVLIAEAERAARPTVQAVSEEILAPPTSALRPPGVESHSEQQPSSRSGRSEKDMANINKTLEEAMKIDGAIGAAIADWDSGMCLGMAGGGSRLNIEVAAAGNCQVVKAKMATMAELGIKGAIQDILITLDDQIHLIRPLKRGENMFMYVAIDKAKGNLALARHRLTKLESELSI